MQLIYDKIGKVKRLGKIKHRDFSTEPLVSIIIANYNGSKYLDGCFSSLFQTYYDSYEVICVDNHSNDDSLVKLNYYKSVFGEKLQIISLQKNTGFTGGNNVGLSKAKGVYVVFLNNDTEVRPEWLTELVNVMEKHSEVGFAQSLLISFENNSQVDSAGDFIDYFGWSAKRGGDWLAEKKNYSSVDDIFSGRGAALIIRMKILEKIGSFDPLYFTSYEDIDLSWRVRLSGYKGVLVPSSVVYHKGSGTPNASIRFHYSKNLMLTHYKNYSYINILRYNPLIIIGGQLIQDMFDNKPVDFCEGLKAILWFIRNFKVATRERLFIQNKIRKVSDNKIKESMLRSSVGLIFVYMLYKAKYGRAAATKWYFERTHQHNWLHF